MLSQAASSSVNPQFEQNSSLLQVAYRRAWVEIDRAALAHNVRQLKQWLSPQTQLMAVVKADAYGHGAVAVAETVLEAGATWLAVATLPEGIQLREAGIDAPILLLGASNTKAEVDAIAHWNLQPTLVNARQAALFADRLTQLGQTLPVHLKIDTGMSRLGTAWEWAAAWVKETHQLPNLKIASLYSHFATADDPDRAMMELQHHRFQTAIAQLQADGLPLPALHLANSAATLCDRALHYDFARTGLALYGLYPAPHLVDSLPLQPVLQVKARVTQVKTIAAGTGISYGHKYIAPREMAIAVVGIGYADGIPRLLSNRLQVLIRGQKVSQVGAITMDQLMLDVSHLPDVQPGEIVTLIGSDGALAISANDWAEAIGTISWEILCGFKHRLPRITVNP